MSAHAPLKLASLRVFLTPVNWVLWPIVRGSKPTGYRCITIGPLVLEWQWT